MMERAFGWIFTALGVGALVGAIGFGAYWHWPTVAMCGLMAWCCFYTAHKEGTKKAQRRIEETADRIGGHSNNL